jgi:RNA polymerase sigma-70 factor (ECF subfamily)
LDENTRYEDSVSVFSLSAGDRHGFATAFERYYLTIYHFAKKFIDNGADAEDITAESFIKLWRHAEQPEGIQNVRTFLHVTTKNACLDYLKTHKGHKKKEEEISFLDRQDTRNAFALAEIKAEVLEEVYAEIEKLPKKCREIFKLSYIEGMKINEVAEHLQISEQTVSNQKTRALKLLRLALQDHHWIVLIWLIGRGRS